MKDLKFIKIALIILLAGNFSCKNSAEAPVEVTAPIKVKTTKVKEESIEEYLTFNGFTKFQKQEDIRASVTGYISWMPFKLGDKIKRGQGFATLRTKEQDALKEAIKIDSSLAKFTHPLQIRSNASGVISNLNVVPNDYVSEGDILATVSQPNTLVVQVSIPFEYSEKIKIGTKCSIILAGHASIDAKISSMLNTTDSIGQSQQYLIKLPSASLPENLNVQVKIVSNRSENALTIPHSAVQTNELLTDYWVLKVVNDSLALKTSVKPILETDSLIQISSDKLKIDDIIIIQGAYQMEDSTKVSIEN